METYHWRVYVHPSGQRHSYPCCCPIAAAHDIPVNNDWLTAEEVDADV